MYLYRLRLRDICRPVHIPLQDGYTGWNYLQPIIYYNSIITISIGIQENALEAKCEQLYLNFRAIGQSLPPWDKEHFDSQPSFSCFPFNQHT